MPDTSTEIRHAVDELNTAFAQFKTENDKSINDRDSLQNEKIQRIDNAMNDLEEKIESLENAQARENALDGKSAAKNEYSSKFYNSFIRKGEQVEAELEQMAIKNDLSIGESSEGGVTLPEETDRAILKLAEDKSPIRQHARVISIGGANYRKLVQHGTAGSGWVGETDPRPKTGTPTFSDITPVFGEVYANPAATQNMLDDAFFNVEGFLRDEMTDEFSRQENIAFVSGDGVKKPKGILAHEFDYADDGARDFGVMQKVKSGVADALPSGVELFDFLIDLQDELKEQHEQNAIFMMHKRTKSVVRKVKDADGNYMWKPGVSGGAPSTLFETPVVTNGNFPTVAANSLCLLYGDLKRAYTIIDRIGTRVLRDPYTNKPYVHFYGTKRVGSMLVDSEAVKVVECAA